MELNGAGVNGPTVDDTGVDSPAVDGSSIAGDGAVVVGVELEPLKPAAGAEVAV